MGKKISVLTEAPSSLAADLLAIVTGGVTKKITKENFRGYKVYSALLSQSGTDAPTVIILENTIGDIVWTRDDIGAYLGTFANAFTLDKTFYYVLGKFVSGLSTVAPMLQRNDVNSMRLYSSDYFSGNDIDDVLSNTPIEIRVYN